MTLAYLLIARAFGWNALVLGDSNARCRCLPWAASSLPARSAHPDRGESTDSTLYLNLS